VEALLLSGRLATEAGHLDLAEQRLTAAVKADEYNAESWYRLGRVHDLSAGNGSSGAAERASAADEYRQALDLDERHAGAAYHLAVIQLRPGATDQAEALLLQAIDSDPGMIDALYLLGSIHLGRDRIEDAKDVFERALWYDADHALSHFGLAQLYTIIDHGPQGSVSPHGSGPHHWREFLRLSEGDPSVAAEREIAIRVLQQILPHLLEE
jgi:tetratricopeptide (TPR) repeat protein